MVRFEQSVQAYNKIGIDDLDILNMQKRREKLKEDN